MWRFGLRDGNAGYPGMTATRRTVLMTGGAALAALASGLRPVAAQVGGRNLVVCLTGITADISPDSLDRATSLFLSRGIPVTAALGLSAQVSAPVFQMAADIALRESGLFEIAVEADAQDEPWRYFQMRRASDLRDRVRSFLHATMPTAQSLPIVTVFTSGAAGMIDLAAYRSAGFLALVRPGKAQRTASFAASGMEQVSLTGGMEFDPSMPEDEVLARTDDMIAANGDCLLALRLPSSGDPPPVWSEVSHRLGAALDRGVLSGALPSDLAQQFSSQPPTSLALLLRFGPADLASEGPLVDLMKELDRLDLPYSVVPPDGDLSVWAGGPDRCEVDTPGLAAGADCAVRPQTALPDPAAAWRIEVTTGETDGWSGLSQDARLTIPAAAGSRAWGLDRRLALASDRVLIVSASDIPTQVDRLALSAALARLRNEGGAKLFSVSGFADHVTAPDPILDRFQSARRRTRIEPPDPAPPTEADRASLIEDARLAWRYIDRMTDSVTGLCAGAAQVGGNGRLVASEQATLWDIASQMQGIVAARRLGLIAAEEAAARLDKILKNIPIQTIDGLRLPPLFVTTDRRGIARAGFDFCDTGRFLIALGAATRAGLIAQDTAATFHAGLDVAGTLREGRPFNHGRSGWTDDFANHCTPYLARGLAPWGLKITSPYPDVPDTPTGDDQMRLLYSIARIGPYGAEPPLLEATELGPTPTTDCMSAVLLDAQIQSFERTGRLKCVSEMSLNTKPWFAYQGLRVDLPGESGWVIRTTDPDPQYNTDSFRDRIEAISSKAAFLWAAHYPHPYTEHLLAVVRRVARVPELGFSVGVFVSDEKPMIGYSDINTNGVILSAIDYLLRTQR